MEVSLLLKKWKGIKDIKEKATKELIQVKEDGYFFYSAPKGYKLIFSIIINNFPESKFEIKDFGIPINLRKEGILLRSLISGDNEMISDNNNPVLELVRIGKMDVEELKRNIRAERQKARLRVQGRANNRYPEDLS